MPHKCRLAWQGTNVGFTNMTKTLTNWLPLALGIVTGLIMSQGIMAFFAA
jgi:hypothetical protein